MATNFKPNAAYKPKTWHPGDELEFNVADHPMTQQVWVQGIFVRNEKSKHEGESAIRVRVTGGPTETWKKHGENGLEMVITNDVHVRPLTGSRTANLRSSLIRLAHSNPSLRPHLLPLLK